MPQRIGAYLHPWDLCWLEDLGGAGKLRDMGFQDLAFPAAYHAGRWTTPTREGALVRFLEDGVAHFRPGQEGYGSLRPLASREVLAASGASPLENCIAAAQGAGLESHAWTVLFHNSRLGQLHPGSCVRNAAGDIYSYALCPAREEVQEYGLALVKDLAGLEGLTTIELEAMGYLGHRHGSHHDKSSFQPDPYLDFLLSYCFCDSCLKGLADQDLDGDELRALVRQLLRRSMLEADAMSPPRLSWQQSFDRLGDDLGRKAFLGLLRHRTVVYMGLLGRMRAVLPEGLRLSLHLNMDPLFTGSQLGQPLNAVISMVDEVVVTHYGEKPARMAELWRGQKADRGRVRVAIWPKAPEFESDKDLVAVQNLVEERNLDGIRIYHLGLLPWPTVQRVMRVFSAV